MTARSELDLAGRYRVTGMDGVAWYLNGYATEVEEVEVAAEDPVTGETIYFYDAETVEDRSRVLAVMVGDDREHVVDVDDLIPLDELDYCHVCGQVGCQHDGLDR